MNLHQAMAATALTCACLLFSGIATAHCDSMDGPVVRDARAAHANSIDAGREYVSAYVDYVHFVESFHRFSENGAVHTHHETE